MISAERFANTNTSYWSMVLPRLDHFVRVTNLGPRRIAAPLAIDFPARRQAIVSERAFVQFQLSMLSDKSGDEYRDLSVRGAERIVHLQREMELLDPFTPPEIKMAETMAGRLSDYFTDPIVPLGQVRIEPNLPGCGVIQRGTPDVTADLPFEAGAPLAIFEVKAVDRNFRSSDFRQLVAYAALAFSDTQALPGLLALVNPLRGTCVEVRSETLLEDAAGQPADEVVQRLVMDWSTAGVSL